MYLFNIFYWLLSILPYLTRQRIIYASGHATCPPYPCHKSLLGGLWALFVIRSVFEFACCFGPIHAHASPSLPPLHHLCCQPPSTSLGSTAAVYCCCLLLLPSVAAFHWLSLPAFTRYNLHGYLGSCCCPHTTASLGPSLPCSASLPLSIYKVVIIS